MCDDDREYPRTDEDGDVICSSCYRDKYEGVGDRCGEIVEKTELAMKPGELFAFFEPVGDLGRGYYRVLGWPIYMDGMIGGYVVERNVRFIGSLDAAGARAAKDAWTPGGCLCHDCQVKVERHVSRYRRRQTRRRKAKREACHG